MKRIQPGLRFRCAQPGTRVCSCLLMLLAGIALCGTPAPAAAPPAAPGKTKPLTEWGATEWKAFGTSVANDPAVQKMSPLDRAKYITDRVGQQYDAAGISPNNWYFGKGRQGIGESPGTCGDLTVNIEAALQGAGYDTGNIEVEQSGVGYYNPFNVNRNHGAPIVKIDGKEYVFDLWYHSGAEGKFAGFKDSSFSMSLDDWKKLMTDEGYQVSNYVQPVSTPVPNKKTPPNEETLPPETPAEPEPGTGPEPPTGANPETTTGPASPDGAGDVAEPAGDDADAEDAEGSDADTEETQTDEPQTDVSDGEDANDADTEGSGEGDEDVGEKDPDAESESDDAETQDEPEAGEPDDAEGSDEDRPESDAPDLSSAEGEDGGDESTGDAGESDGGENSGDAESAADGEASPSGSGYVENSGGRTTLTENRGPDGSLISVTTTETRPDGTVISQTTYPGGRGEGQTTTPDTDLKGSEAESDGDVDANAATGGYNTSGSFAAGWSQGQEQRGTEGGMILAGNTQMGEAANVGNQTLSDANTVRDGGGQDYQTTRDNTARTVNKADQQNSWGKALGDAVEQGITEGGKAFGTALGGAAADQAVGAIFGSPDSDDGADAGNSGDSGESTSSDGTSVSGDKPATKGKSKPDKDGSSSGGSSGCNEPCDGDSGGDGNSGGETTDGAPPASDDPLGVTGSTSNDDGTVTIRYGCGYSWTGTPPGPSRCPICSRETVSTETNPSPPPSSPEDDGTGGYSGSDADEPSEPTEEPDEPTTSDPYIRDIIEYDE